MADIVALAKAGFKVSDIKELLAVEAEETSIETKETETNETKSEQVETKEPETQDNQSVLEEIASLREQIAALQKGNTQKEIVIKDTTEKTEEDVFSKFFK